MATLSEHHQELNEYGEGKCSVPMWRCGLPAGFCDKPAYSEHKGGKYYVNPRTGDIVFFNGAYGGFVPALACPFHGGKTKEQAVNLCDKCCNCLANCDGDPKFGTGKGNDNVYEYNGFMPKIKK